MPKQKNFYKQQQQQQKQKERQQQRSIKQSLKKQRNQARKLKGYAKHFDEFQEELNQLGLQIRDVDGDGNCLFRSIADVLQGSERFHKQYRKLAVQAMEQNTDFYSLFIEDDMTFNDYLREMNKDGEWGGNLELSAIAQELDINFFIHMKGRPAMIITSMEDDRNRNEILTTKKSVHLAYHLVENVAEHYSAVRMLGDDKQEPAQEIPLNLFEGLIDQMKVNQDTDFDKIDDLNLEGAQFETPEEEEFMRQYLEDLRIQKLQEEQFLQQQQNINNNYQLKQKKNAKCQCGSKKTYKDCCMQKDILKQQQPQQQQQQQQQQEQQQQKKSAVFI